MRPARTIRQAWETLPPMTMLTEAERLATFERSAAIVGRPPYYPTSDRRRRSHPCAGAPSPVTCGPFPSGDSRHAND